MRRNFSNLASSYAMSWENLQITKNSFRYATYDPSPGATEAYKLVKVGSHNVDTKNVRDIEMKHPIYGINFGSLFDGAKREQK